MRNTAVNKKDEGSIHSKDEEVTLGMVRRHLAFFGDESRSWDAEIGVPIGDADGRFGG